MDGGADTAQPGAQDERENKRDGVKSKMEVYTVPCWGTTYLSITEPVAELV